jgi:predicted nucleotide-binding protein
VPSRLLRPTPEVEQIIRRHAVDGGELLNRADEAAGPDAWDAWDHERKRWVALTKDALLACYEGDAEASEFERSATRGLVRQMGQTLNESHEYGTQAVENGINTLLSLQDRLEYALGPSEREPPQSPEHRPFGDTIFIVHGRDQGLRDQVARVLGQLGFKPRILGEEANEGRTLVEKFEAVARDAGYAVVILSPDDWARGPDEDAFPSTANRARQNIILELGYFWGQLGRNRVTPLYANGTEIPSDLHGLGYVELDAAGAWRFKLADELRAAGYSVDKNLL